MSADAFINLFSGSIGGAGVLAIFIILLLTDKIHTNGEFARILEALNNEKEAHNETRRALDEAAKRADSAVAASEIIAKAISGDVPRRRKREARDDI